ncbi:MAG: hypothetical protein HRT82_16315 [Henriciella sp.]|nr:hypothetical protein [Henriciella sp.]
MIADAFTRLSGTVGSTPTGQDLTGTSSASPSLSDNFIDLADDSLPFNGNLADGELCATFTVTDTFTSGDPDSSVSFDIITRPRQTGGGQPFTGTAADDTITVTGDRLTPGTLVRVSGNDRPGNLAANTFYFILSSRSAAGAEVVQLSLTAGGPPVAISSDGSGTITEVPHVLATSGNVPLGRLVESDAQSGVPGFTQLVNAKRVGDRIVLRANPLPHSANAPLHRYLYARVNYSGTGSLTAGGILCDIGLSVPSNTRIQHASGFTL